MKCAIIGANGQLGSDLVVACKREGHQVTALTHADLNVEDPESVSRALEGIQPDVILNTSAFHVVPQCEDQPDKAFAVNGRGALNIARLAERIGAVSVYYSTDYVFDGAKKRPYIEADRPNPLNVYAATKLTGEYFTLHYSEKSFVIRISGIYGKVPCRAKGGNFVTTMLRLAKEKPEVRVVDDEILTPTPTADIAVGTLAILRSHQYGLYHLTCEGECSWYEFARTIFETLKIHTPLVPTTVQEFKGPVNRPVYSVLENDRYNREIKESRMPHWKDALVTFLKERL